MGRNRILDYSKVGPRMRKMYENGLSLRKIAIEFKISHSTVNKILSIMGVDRRDSETHKGRRKMKDIVGKRFGKLVVVGRDGDKYPPLWIVSCDCGKSKRYTRPQILVRRSCGCGARQSRK